MVVSPEEGKETRIKDKSDGEENRLNGYEGRGKRKKVER